MQPVTLFTAEETARLETAHKNFLANMSTLSDLEYRKEMERFGVDLSGKSSQIEGNAVLIAWGYCPISFRTVDYKKAILMLYEQNNIAAFKQIFIEQYEFALKNYF